MHGLQAEVQDAEHIQEAPKDSARQAADRHGHPHTTQGGVPQGAHAAISTGGGVQPRGRERGERLHGRRPIGFQSGDDIGGAIAENRCGIAASIHPHRHSSQNMKPSYTVYVVFIRCLFATFGMWSVYKQG